MASLGRNLRRHRATNILIFGTIVPVLAGISALFSIVDAVLLQPPPYPEADRIVHLSAPLALFRTVPDRARRTEDRAATTPLMLERVFVRPATVFQLESEAVVDWRLRPAAVSAAFFGLFGAVPRIGQPFRDNDARARPRPAIISDVLWRTVFRSDPAVVGRIVDIPGTLRREPWVIAGVMPEDFRFPPGANFWIPFDPTSFAPALTPDFARLAPAVTVPMLREDLPGVSIVPLSSFVQPHGARILGFLLVAVTIFVLIAWTQVMSRIAIQVLGDAPGIGIQIALGASLRRVIHETGVEALAVVGLGFLTSLLLVSPFAAGLLKLLPAEFSLGRPLTPEWRTWLFMSALCGVGVTVWTVVAASIVGRAGPAALLRGNISATVQRRSSPMRRRLFVLHIALVSTLVHLSSLAFISYQRVSAIRMGFIPTGLLALPIPIPASPRGTPDVEVLRIEARHRQRAADTLAAIRALPDVADASFSDFVPLGQHEVPTTLLANGDAALSVTVVRQSIGSGFLNTAHASLAAGREPTPDEIHPPRPGAPMVRPVIVNERLAALLGAADGLPTAELWSSSAMRYRVVGVVKNLVTGRLDSPVEPAVYSYFPPGSFGPFLLVRTAASADLWPQLRQLMISIWGPDLAPKRAIAVSDLARDQTAQYRASVHILGWVLLGGLPLAILGVSSAVSHYVAVRRLRTAVETAIGASPDRITRTIVSEILRPSFGGVCLGCLVGVSIGFVLQGRLFGVLAIDPGALAASASVPLLIASGAAWIHARRASVANPTTTLSATQDR